MDNTKWKSIIKADIFCANIFTILTNLFTNYRMINATDTFEYGIYTVNVKYYLYKDILIINKNTKKPE